MNWTVVGARGFIGSAFVRVLRARGEAVTSLTHREAATTNAELGHVIYASGVAWDAGKRVADAVAMHVEIPLALLGKRLQSLAYISSTRVYGDAPQTDEEAVLRVRADDVYGATKAAGEAAILADPRAGMRIVRLSNVYGPSFGSGLMLSDFLRQAATTGQIVVRSSGDSSKDHVSIEDVVDMTLRIATGGAQRVYNIAAGKNTRQGDLLDALALASGCNVDVAPGSPTVTFEPIDIRRISTEFGFTARDVLRDVPALWEAFRAHFRREAVR